MNEYRWNNCCVKFVFFRSSLSSSLSLFYVVLLLFVVWLIISHIDATIISLDSPSPPSSPINLHRSSTVASNIDGRISSSTATPHPAHAAASISSALNAGGVAAPGAAAVYADSSQNFNNTVPDPTDNLSPAERYVLRELGPSGLSLYAQFSSGGPYCFLER